MKSINIFGCCVSRDIFPDEQNKYKIQQYVAISSPISASAIPPKNPIELKDLDGFVSKRGDNFRQRCMLFDINKTGFDYIADKISDYIIVDIADARLSVAKFGDNCTVSCAVLLHQNKALFEERFGKLTPYPFDHWSESEWNDAIDWFCQQILKLYGRNNIILLEALNVNEYRNKNNRIQQFPIARQKLNSKFNTHLKRLFSICEKNLEGCHVIRMPDNVFADVSHKLGLLPLHYHDLYYKYAFEALQIITDGEQHEEKQRLEELRTIYSDRLALLRYQLTVPPLQATNKKLTDYSYYFSWIIEHYDEALEIVSTFCKTNGIQSVAFYGDYLTSSVLLSILNKINVRLDYIIGNWNNHKFVPLYSPNLKSYPQTDAIVICNIVESEKTKAKMLSKVEIPVFSIFDILPYNNA